MASTTPPLRKAGVALFGGALCGVGADWSKE